MKKNLTQYVLYFDLLNIVACVCVVAMHCNGLVHTYSDARCWKTSLIVETAAYWAVPVFFMLTGATLMDYRERYSTKEYFIKRFIKTAIPFVVWSMIFLALKVQAGDIAGSSLNVLVIFRMIINNEILAMYWFFFALFAVYFAIPVVSAIPKEKRTVIFNYVIIYAICFISVLPVILPLIGIPFNGALSPAICGGYLLFVILGYQLTKVELSRKVRIIIYLCGVGGWAIRFFSTLVLSQKLGSIYKGFWEYSSFPTVAFAIAVFVWFQYHDWGRILQKQKLVRIVRHVSSASFGIYLIHWLFIWKLPGLFGISTASWQWRTIGALCIYALTLLCVSGMKKIYLIRKIVP